MDHVKRYSKSRRKAPIYWYLRSAKGNYGLWLYYHRLDKDILFKALLNYVEPKIRLEEDRLRTLRGRKEAAGSSGREAKQLEKEIDRQEQFVSELKDFEERLRRAANLHLDFDLNDGVILNMAPLWELVPWNEPKKYDPAFAPPGSAYTSTVANGGMISTQTPSERVISVPIIMPSTFAATT